MHDEDVDCLTGPCEKSNLYKCPGQAQVLQYEERGLKLGACKQYVDGKRTHVDVLKTMQVPKRFRSNGVQYQSA